MEKYFMYHNANFQSFVRPNYHQPTAAQTKYDEIAYRAQQQHTQQAAGRAKSATVYAGEYREKELDRDCQAAMRPSSATRMNKPHPPEIFLVTTLHNMPGYYNCEGASSLGGKGKVYRKNSPVHKEHRGALRDNNQVFIFRETDSNTAAQAWLKLASDKDHDAVQKMIRFVTEKQMQKIEMGKKRTAVHQKLTEIVKPEFIPSAQQWQQNAGLEETTAVERLLRTLYTGHRTPMQSSLTEATPFCRPYRADYLIHPDWRSQH
ncbi:uncharacterized protein [Hyperolius riggenbachi]|uniref:uncharacterized protein n=1 Tax=Hyperolius riggenbachi TaxID=752182 RepID=UPI0035A36EAF